MSDLLKQFQDARAALVEEKTQLEAQLVEINRALGTMSPNSASRVTSKGTTDRRSGPKSPEWRAAIAAAQKLRWAKIRGEKPGSVGAPAKDSDPEAESKRTMSPAAKAKIAKAARNRWKKAKAAGKNAL